ncbi:MAG: hypothetical protein K8H86_09345 [Ignavibacteriaceae bacterium]|nr:hypothetical protein [Ignavibacteriaceae bacterium]
MTLNNIIYTVIIAFAIGGLLLVVVSFLISRSKEKRSFIDESEVNRAEQDFKQIRTHEPALADYSTQVFSLRTNSVNHPDYIRSVEDVLPNYSQNYESAGTFDRRTRPIFYEAAVGQRVIPRMKVVNDYFINNLQNSANFRYTPYD